MRQVALNRPRTNNRDFDAYIVKATRLHARQRGHLRAALDLKNADRVRLAHHVEGARVVLRQLRQIDRVPALSCQFHRVLQHGHHAQPKQIDFDDAHVLAIILVPLRHDTSRHGGVFQRDDGIEFAFANDHAAGMLAKMARQAVNLVVKREERRSARMLAGQPGLLHLR